MNLALITTFKLSSVLLVTLCFSFIITFVTGDSECHQVGCGCQFTNDTGTYEISMKELKKPGDYYTVTDGGWTYHINPCYEFTQTDCQDVTMCQKPQSGPSFPIAKYDIKNFSEFVNMGTAVKVTYQAIVVGVSRQMIINLKCGNSKVPPKEVKQSGSNPITYTLQIVSPLLCPQKSGGSSSGLSTGSVIVIMIAVYSLARK